MTPRPEMSRPLREMFRTLRVMGCALADPDLDRHVRSRAEAQALAWHQAKHHLDSVHGFDDNVRARLQIAHVSDWPNTKEFSQGFPPLIAERRFHALTNVLLLCPEAHDLYDGAGLFSADLIRTAARVAMTRPEARDPLLQYLHATVSAEAGHQTENTNVYLAAEYLRADHGIDTRRVVEAFELRVRVAEAALATGDNSKIHRGDAAVFSLRESGHDDRE